MALRIRPLKDAWAQVIRKDDGVGEPACGRMLHGTTGRSSGTFSGCAAPGRHTSQVKYNVDLEARRTATLIPHRLVQRT